MNSGHILFALIAGVATALIATLWCAYTDFALVYLLMLIFLLVALFPPAVKVIRGRFDPLEAENFFILPFILYSLILPLWKISQGASGDEFTLMIYVLVCLIGLVFFYIGYYTKLANALEKSLPWFSRISHTRLGLGGWFIAVVALVLIFFLFQLAGGLRGYLEVGYGTALQLIPGTRGYLGYGFDFIIVAILALLASRLRRGGRLLSLGNAAIGVLLISFLAFEFLMGERLQMMMLLIGLLVVYHYSIRTITLKQTIFIGALGYVAAMMFSHIRSELPYGIVATLKAMIARVSLITLSPASSGEFTLGPPSALWELLEMGWDRIPFVLGLSYLRGFGTFIPLALWPGRPMALAQWRLATLHPELYEAGGGLAYFTVAEGFLNFGFVGVAIQMFIYGVLARTAYLHLMRDPHNKANVLLYAITLPVIFVGIRSDIVPAFKNYLVGYLLPLLMILLWAGSLYVERGRRPDMEKKE